MRTLVRKLLRRVKPGSLVCIHDSLLIFAGAFDCYLEACLTVFTLCPLHTFKLKLRSFSMIRTHQDPSQRAEVQALVTTESRPTKACKLARAAPTGETLHNFWFLPLNSARVIALSFKWFIFYLRGS